MHQRKGLALRQAHVAHHLAPLRRGVEQDVVQRQDGGVKSLRLLFFFVFVFVDTLRLAAGLVAEERIRRRLCSVESLGVRGVGGVQRQTGPFVRLDPQVRHLGGRREQNRRVLKKRAGHLHEPERLRRSHRVVVRVVIRRDTVSRRFFVRLNGIAVGVLRETRDAPPPRLELRHETLRDVEARLAHGLALVRATQRRQPGAEIRRGFLSNTFRRGRRSRLHRRPAAAPRRPRVRLRGGTSRRIRSRFVFAFATRNFIVGGRRNGGFGPEPLFCRTPRGGASARGGPFRRGS